MKDSEKHSHEIQSFDEFDERINPPPRQTDFERILDQAISRRGLLKGVLVHGPVAALAGSGVAALTTRNARAASDRFAFEAVASSSADKVTLPAGYNGQILVSWGDPLWSNVPEFDPATRGTAASQAGAFGDNTDGMELFSVDGHMLLAVNNEYSNQGIMWGNLPEGKPQTDDDVNKIKMAHGLTVVEIRSDDQGRWSIVKDSPYNRRVTPDTEMAISGAARGHDLMKTAADPDGVTCFGTWNNCANGSTPWGTYLACEENFNGYFSTSDETWAATPAQQRYGVSNTDRGYSWASVDERFDVAKHPNESNRAGWVVELDPGNPGSVPKKRTSLGRFKHENAELVVNNDGRIVVYMGDDERGEFMYRYVSNGVFAPGLETDSLLDDGRLYVAKFHENGVGEWFELNPETTGMASQAEVCIHARVAASAVGATTMDRPEWISANPIAPEVYCALTNNKNRGIKPNAGGDSTDVNGPNPRMNNQYGQIVRLKPTGGDHTADVFAWDLFVMAGNPTVHADANAGSSNVTADNMFNSPDGLKFDRNGLLWIQTDGNYSNQGDFAGQGNNQMLAADPVTGEIRRFLVGPNECEITGLAWSPDYRTMFVGVQHPGERGNSHWPGGGDSVPRSTIIAIRRDDGGLVG